MSKVATAPAAPAATPIKATPIVAAKKTVAGSTDPAAGAAAPVTAAGAAVAAPGTPGTQAVAKKGPGVQRSKYDLATAVIFDRDASGAVIKGADGKAVTKSAVNAEGKLIAVPDNYDFSKNSAMKEADFIDTSTYLEFKAAVADTWAARYLEAAKSYRSTAERIRKVGKPEDRKRIAKLEKMRKEYQQMNEALYKEGHITKEEYEAGLTKMAAVAPLAAAA